MKKLQLFATLSLAVCILAACSHTQEAQKSASETVATTPQTISIKNLTFSPASLTIKKGLKVTWKNEDSEVHTVTFDRFGSAMHQT